MKKIDGELILRLGTIEITKQGDEDCFHLFDWFQEDGPRPTMDWFTGVCRCGKTIAAQGEILGNGYIISNRWIGGRNGEAPFDARWIEDMRKGAHGNVSLR